VFLAILECPTRRDCGALGWNRVPARASTLLLASPLGLPRLGLSRLEPGLRRVDKTADVTVWVVRHGCAGHKEDWCGNDDGRPLDPAGTAQAAAVAELLVNVEPRRLLSSPTRRCMDTLQPLAVRLGLSIEVDIRLCPQYGHVPLIDIIRDPLSDGTVVCSHGEAMKPLLSEFRQQHLSVVGGEPEGRLLLKGVAWELDVADPPRLRLHAPVPVGDCPKHPQM
jgi:phosphohistidine phosphatase SixA